MNKQIITLIAENNTLYKHLKGKMVNSKSLDKLDTLQAKLQSLIYLFNLSYQALCWLQSHFREHKFRYNF